MGILKNQEADPQTSQAKRANQVDCLLEKQNRQKE